MKHLLLLPALMLMVLLTAFNQKANAQYKLQLSDVVFEHTTGTIKKYLNSTEKDIIIPASFNVGGNDYSVSILGSEAFFLKDISGVIIPSSVDSIGDYTFGRNLLTNVTIPNSVTKIGNNAFAFNKLTSITISNSISIINYGVFYGNELNSVVIPSSVTKIDDYAFSKNKFTELTIAGTIKQIGNSVFSSNKLTKLVIEVGTETIGATAFAGNELESIIIPESVTFIDASSFRYNKITEINGEPSKGLIYARGASGGEDKSTILGYGGDATIIDFIPDHVSIIGGRSFRKTIVSEIIFPNSITRIEDDAFVGSDLDMSKISIPNSVVYIGKNAFLDIKAFAEFDLPINIIGYEHGAEWKNDSDVKVTRYSDPYKSYGVVGTLTNYSIIYNADGGYHSNAIFNRTIETNDVILKPATRGSDIFSGWYDNDSFLGDPISKIAKGDAKNITLWAKFDVTTSARNIMETNKINVFPNPAVSQIIVDGVKSGEQISFYNAAGVMVKQVVASSNKQIISISDISKGIYILKVGNKAQRLSVKR